MQSQRQTISLNCCLLGLRIKRTHWRQNRRPLRYYAAAAGARSPNPPPRRSRAHSPLKKGRCRRRAAAAAVGGRNFEAGMRRLGKKERKREMWVSAQENEVEGKKWNAEK